MHQSTSQALEEIDAAVFSGDVLYTDLSTVKSYVERWARAIAEHERIEAQAGESSAEG